MFEENGNSRNKGSLYKIDHLLGRVAAFLVGTSAVQSELTTMTDQSDLRSDIRDDKFYISWIIRGGVVLALVIAVLAFISTGSYPDLEAPQLTTTVPASVF